MSRLNDQLDGLETLTREDLKVRWAKFTDRPVPKVSEKLLRLAYLAPAVLDKLLISRVPPAVSIKDMAAAAELPWADQEAAVFGQRS